LTTFETAFWVCVAAPLPHKWLNKLHQPANSNTSATTGTKASGRKSILAVLFSQPKQM